MDPKWSTLALAIVILQSAATFNAGSGQEIELFFGVLVGDKGNEGVVSGIQAALDEISGNNDLLPGYKLKYNIASSEVCIVN